MYRKRAVPHFSHRDHNQGAEISTCHAMHISTSMINEEFQPPLTRTNHSEETNILVCASQCETSLQSSCKFRPESECITMSGKDNKDEDPFAQHANKNLLVVVGEFSQELRC